MRIEDRGDAIAKMYTSSMYGIWGSRRPRLQDWERQLLESYCPDHRASILVVGCGNGRETFAIHETGFHNVQGVDITPAFVDLQRSQSRELGIDVEFTVARADALPFADEHFDVLTMFVNIYGHITPRSLRLEVLDEARRVLKPGGILFIEATSRYHGYRYRVAMYALDMLHRLYNPCLLEPGDKLMRSARKLGVAPSAYPRSHWFRPGEIDAEAATAPLEVLRATTVKGFIEEPSGHATSYRGKRGLLYVLRKPSVTAATTVCAPSNTQ